MESGQAEHEGMQVWKTGLGKKRTNSRHVVLRLTGKGWGLSRRTVQGEGSVGFLLVSIGSGRDDSDFRLVGK